MTLLSQHFKKFVIKTLTLVSLLRCLWVKVLSGSRLQLEVCADLWPPGKVKRKSKDGSFRKNVNGDLSLTAQCPCLCICEGAVETSHVRSVWCHLCSTKCMKCSAVTIDLQKEKTHD